MAPGHRRAPGRHALHSSTASPDGLQYLANIQDGPTPSLAGGQAVQTKPGCQPAALCFEANPQQGFSQPIDHLPEKPAPPIHRRSAPADKMEQEHAAGLQDPQNVLDVVEGEFFCGQMMEDNIAEDKVLAIAPYR